MTNISNLRIGHLNVRGLEHHIDGVKFLLDAQQYHVFGVTETKMRASAPVGPVRVPAYNLIRHSLPSGRGRGSKACGGVGLYVRQGLKATPVIKSTHDNAAPIATRVEYMVVQIKINELNVGVAVVYNPSCSNPTFAVLYEKVLLEMLDLGFDRTFIVGDFNINVASVLPSLNLTSLRRIHSTFNLTVLPTGPTRITDTTSTTIDLLITDCPQSIRKAKAVSASAISDHEVIYLLADVLVRNRNRRTIRVRNFRNVDVLQLQAEYQAKDFQRFYESNDVEEKTALLTADLQDLLDRHAPERTIYVRDERTPWITQQIKQTIELRDLALKLYKRNPNRRRGDQQWLEHSRLHDRANSLIHAAKTRYADQHFGHELPAKKLWCNLRREGIHNSTKSGPPAEGIDADDLNRFFSDGHRELGTGQRSAQQREPAHRTAVDHGRNGFNFRQTNAEEVNRKILEIQTNATGTDGIPISFVKMLCPLILPELCHLFNAIIAARTFPSLWKTAIVTPIPKTPSPSLPKHFRPISVLPAVSKVLEKILLDQITDHLENPNLQLLAKHQSGYRKGFGTTTALAKVTHDIYGNLDNNNCTVMVLVDFSLAFNCVNHHLLENKLNREFRFSSAACKLVASFLGQRKQMVRLGDKVSAVRDVTDGTPQGSCLSALLFSLFINSLPGVLRCEYQLYADDLQIYVSGPIEQIEDLIASINTDLAAITNWANQNQLHPNPKKTQAIVFTKAGSVQPHTDIVFSGEVVPLCEKVVNLGLQLDNNMTWKHQTNSVTQRVYNTLRTFRRFAAVLSQPTRRKLVQAVIVPMFTYCDIVYYHGLSAALKEQLHRCFKSAVRFVYNLRRRDTTAAVRHTLLGHDLPINYQLRTSCFMKKGYDGNLPEYLQQHLVRGQLERTRSFIIPRHTTMSGKSVLVAGTTCWNNLPAELKGQPTLLAFKNAFKRTIRN
ncbi:uncharacterized protein LOC120429543 [Culex pipiens pallens]|uniref:uncharacterized protein LOC120429543 n=1 Tax=Culex pipiens pallens TaxID=42434 RepID=UPI001954EF33|nr:uncharacterized protein LOC120429543 [Culex pipiens pallens]